MEGTSIDVTCSAPLPLAQLARAIGGSKDVVEWLTTRLVEGHWFATSIPPILEELARLRNPGAPSSRVERNEAKRWRRQLMGIGCEGEGVGGVLFCS